MVLFSLFSTMTIAISKRTGLFQRIKNPAKQKGGVQTFLTIVNLVIIFSCIGTLIYQCITSLERFLGYETKAILTGKGQFSQMTSAYSHYSPNRQNKIEPSLLFIWIFLLFIGCGHGGNIPRKSEVFLSTFTLFGEETMNQLLHEKMYLLIF